MMKESRAQGIRWILALMALFSALGSGAVAHEPIRRNIERVRLLHRGFFMTQSLEDVSYGALRQELIPTHNGRPDYVVVIWDAYSGNYAVALGELEMYLREGSISRAQYILMVLARQAWRALEEGDADSAERLADSLDLIIIQFGRDWLPPDSGYGDAWNIEIIFHLASEGREVESRIALRMADLLHSKAYLENSGEVFSQLGRLYYDERHDLQTALGYYWRAVQSLNRGEDYRVLASIYAELGDYPSIERVGRVAVQNGKDEWGYHVLGIYYARIGSLDEAERYWKEVLAQENIDSQGLLRWRTELAYAHFKQYQGDLSAAAFHYEQAAAFRPGTGLEAYALSDKAEMYAGAQRWIDAIHAYQRALMLPAPNIDWTVEVHQGLARAYSELGECDQAREHFQIAKGYGADDLSLSAYISRCAPNGGTQ